MAKAGKKATSSETPIPLGKAALEVQKFCSAKEAAPVMVRGFRDERIHLSGRRLEGLHPGDPTPGRAEFWQKRDPRTGGDVQHSPRFPWADNVIVRKVYSRHDPRRRRQLLSCCTVYGAAVLWSEVVALFLTNAQLKLAAPMTAAPLPPMDSEVATIASAQWAVATTRNLQAENKLAKGIKQAELARLLEAEAQKAVKTGKIGRALKASYIENQLAPWGIWPLA